MKTAELTGPALDWAVAEANGTPVKIVCGILYTKDGDNYQPSTDWAQGGPIIELEMIEVLCESPRWLAIPRKGPEWRGPTPLVAAMRCYVASKIGNEVQIPEELE